MDRLFKYMWWISCHLKQSQCHKKTLFNTSNRMMMEGSKRNYFCFYTFIQRMVSISSTNGDCNYYCVASTLYCIFIHRVCLFSFLFSVHYIQINTIQDKLRDIQILVRRTVLTWDITATVGLNSWILKWFNNTLLQLMGWGGHFVNSGIMIFGMSVLIISLMTIPH